MKRRVFLLSATGTALAAVSPRKADASSVFSRLARVSDFPVFAGPRLIGKLRPGSALRLVQLKSNRAHAAVYLGDEQIGTLALDTLGIMSCRVPRGATIRRLDKNPAGKHEVWIECRW